MILPTSPMLQVCRYSIAIFIKKKKRVHKGLFPLVQIFIVRTNPSYFQGVKSPLFPIS